MNRKRLLLLAAALLVAVVTALGARSLFAGAAAPTAFAAPEPASGPRVLVAQRMLPVGTILTADAVTLQAWPRELVRDAYFLGGAADTARLVGTVVRYPVPAGQPLTRGALVSPGDRGFLAAALAPGMRAVTIAVSAKTGVGGFVFPGDRVDVLLTQSVEANGANGGGGRPLNATETILENLRVLATDQSTESETAGGKTVVHAVGTVTLEVTPRLAEKIAVAQTIGELGLSLRAIADDAAGGAPAGDQRLVRRATASPIDGGGFVTGGDVSRFQRRTVPVATAAIRTAPNAAPTPGFAPARAPRGPIVTVTRGGQAEPVVLGAS